MRRLIITSVLVCDYCSASAHVIAPGSCRPIARYQQTTSDWQAMARKRRLEPAENRAHCTTRDPEHLLLALSTCTLVFCNMHTFFRLDYTENDAIKRIQCAL
jgi:hypothetical protein